MRMDWSIYFLIRFKPRSVAWSLRTNIPGRGEVVVIMAVGLMYIDITFCLNCLNAQSFLSEKHIKLDDAKN